MYLNPVLKALLCAEYLFYDFFFKNHFQMEVELIYNVMLVSGMQQSDSVLYIDVYIDSFPSYVMTRY